MTQPAKTARLLLASLLLLQLAQAQSTPPQKISGAGQALEGTWEYAAEQTSPPPVTGFRGLMTFLPGGAVIGTDEINFSGLGAAAGFLQTAGQGEWVRTGDREFLVNLIKLNFDARGRLLGWVKIKAALRLRDNLRSVEPATGTFDIYLPDGRVAASGRFSFQAQRMELETP